MSDDELFLTFEKNEYINLQDLPILENFICGYLNSCYSPNRAYCYRQFNYVTKLFIVCNWKQKRGLPVSSRRGETICEGRLVNFFEDEEHKNCTCSVV